MAIQVKFEEWYDNIDKKMEEFFNNVYKRVPGIYFGFIGLIIYALSTFTAFLIYITVDPSYSIFTHWISHLGDGPNGANLVFNTGWMVSSIILLFFYVYLIRELRKKGAPERILDLMSLAVVFFSVGLLLVALFPLHLGVSHMVAGTFYFIGGFGIIMLYGILALMLPKVPKKYGILAFISAGSFITYFLSPIIGEYTSNVGFTITFLEWLTLLSELLLMLVVISHDISERVKQRRIQKLKDNVRNLMENDWIYKNELIEYVESFYK